MTKLKRDFETMARAQAKILINQGHITKEEMKQIDERTEEFCEKHEATRPRRGLPKLRLV
jgi:hypothetical protein